MQEQTVTVGKATYELPQPFMVLATQNPIEMEGTYPLPEAQLDRFLFKLNVKFPTLEELHGIMDVTTSGKEIELKQIVDCNDIMEIRRLVKGVPISKAVMDYALRVVLATHPESTASQGHQCPEATKKYVRYGASPRAAQAIINTSKVRAMLEGRYNVAFEDIKYVAYPSLRHRFFLNFDAITDGITADDLIGTILESVSIE